MCNEQVFLIVVPLKVTYTALENAVSVAAMFLTTESLVADEGEEMSAPAVAGNKVY